MKIKFVADITKFLVDLNKLHTNFEKSCKQGINKFSVEALKDVRKHVSDEHTVRLGNTWRKKVYPEGKNSINSAALLWSKAPEIMTSFSKGAIVRARNKSYMAIPTKEAYRKVGIVNEKGVSIRYRLTPDIWMKKGFPPLIFVARKGKSPVLVARLFQSNSGKSFRTEKYRSGSNVEASLVVFTLVKVVKHNKSVSPIEVIEKRVEQIPSFINKEFGD